MHPRIYAFDRAVTGWMLRWGQFLHRDGLGIFFLWIGLLKVFGYKSATSLIAQAIYLGPTDTMVVILGLWESLIGLCLLIRPAIRVALVLLAIRLPGTILALLIRSDVCFDSFPLVPTVVGQYLIKDAILITAAIVIGGAIHVDRYAQEERVVQLD